MWPTFSYCLFRGKVRSSEGELRVSEAGDVKSGAALSSWLDFCSGSRALGI